MRIRKHAKISSLVYATAAHKTAAILQPHVCQLNQSPWDVMSFSPPSTPHPPPPPSQVDRNDVSAGNGSSRNPISAFEREMNAWLQPEYPNNPARRTTTPAAAVSAVAPAAAVAVVAPAAAVAAVAPAAAEKEENKMELEPPPKKKEEIILCCKTDGKNWQCKNEAAKGNSLCDHHISQMKSYSHNNATHNTTKKSGKQAAAAAEAPPPPAPRRSRPKKSPKSSSSANPYEFYYYSGFGPRWGKKRGEASGGGGGSYSNTNSMPENTRNEQEIEVSVCDDEDSDYVEYEEEEDVQENRDNNGKKRVRKPIKARSLKSLM